MRNRARCFAVAVAACCAAACACAAPARPARRGAARPVQAGRAQTASRQTAAAALPAHVRSPYFAALAVDAATGRTLFECRADEKAYPASITKLMTAFIVLDDVKAGRFSLDDMVAASPVRTALDKHLRQPSNTGIRPGESLSVRSMLETLLVRSANDSAVYLAEKCSGSMEAFVGRMNEKAKSLGMASTVFYNPNGLPPLPGAKSGGFNASTCRDLAKMARALLAEHPEILSFTSIKVLKFKSPSGEVQNFVNHNNVMVKNKLKVVNPDGTEAADGLKTGFIRAGGFSVLLTGKREGKRAIVVVLGSPSKEERDQKAAELLSDALDALCAG